MPTYLTTIQSQDLESGEFTPRIRLRQFRNDAILRSIVAGRRIQLRRPDGTRLSTTLEEINVEGLTREAYSSADDATLYSFPNDPVMSLTFALPITGALAPAGTEIWLID